MKASGKVLFGMLCVMGVHAFAQQAVDKKTEQVASAPMARCVKEVREYLDTMKFIRQAAGNQIGDRVAAGLLSEPQVQKVMGEQGPCPAAQMIRERSMARASAS